MLNLTLKLSLTSVKNKFPQNNWHDINHMSVLNQEILINPELSHACIKTAIFSASAIFALLNDVKNISDVTKVQQQCDTLY